MSALMPRRRRTALGFAIRAALLLVLGVLTSVGVAWWAAWNAEAEYSDRVSAYAISVMAGKPPQQSVEDIRDGVRPWETRIPLRWPITVPGDFPIAPEIASQQSGFGWTFTYAHTRVSVDGWRFGQASPRLSNDHPAETIVECFGLPFRCVGYWYWTDYQPGSSVRSSKSTLPVLPLPRFAKDRLLNGAFPIMPLWPGLIANTVIYSACWWVLLRTPRTIRRFNRRRRGRCTMCGYSLAGLAPGSVCPECGV